MSYDNYDPGGLTIEELSNQLMALQSRLASTISDVKREDGKLTEKQSQILQDIDSIALSVSELNTLSDGHTVNISSLVIRADGIESTVTALDSRIGAAETSITQQAGQIALKASVDYVDGELAPVVSEVDGVKSRLASAEASITVQATQIQSKVSQTTYESGFNELYTYTDDKTAHAEENAMLYADDLAYNLNSRISIAESSITQNANQIALKVSQTDYTGATLVSMIEQTASHIKLAASKIDLYGITHVNGELHIGDPTHTSTKTIWFNNAGNISATGFGNFGLHEIQFNTSNINFEPIDYMWFNPDFAVEIYGKLDFTNATVTGLNTVAVFG